MAIRVKGDLIEVAPPSDQRFDAMREARAEVAGSSHSGPGGPKRMLEAVRLTCVKGGRVHDGIECLTCDRFVNYVPSPDGAQVSIRCRWNEHDPISDIMTPLDALVTVTSASTLKAAEELAVAEQVHHLLVVDDDELVGVICQCDLSPRPRSLRMVAERMASSMWIASPMATLGEAVTVMREQRIGCLPVVEGEDLVGVVTRTDLARVGVDDYRFG